MASGCPALISSASCLPEVGGSSAWQVDALEVESIRAGLAHTLQDDAWRAQAVAEGLRIAATLTWQRCFDATRGLYHRLLPVTP